ncbi:hypothetical protein ES319_A11G179000v1 [Gossypium barbadense]|uniref:Uncharacterized protein n=1 Tax=Gossypium barbadense TaxID=3634 RepID=A0A5J5TS62_GOSBA|nr:hypothetical protein ES319_A11G179000v1 [Gossypium barbadense]
MNKQSRPRRSWFWPVTTVSAAIAGHRRRWPENKKGGDGGRVMVGFWVARFFVNFGSLILGL